MRLRIITPRDILLDTQVNWIRAEAPNGAFGMYPQHIDFVSQLVPGLIVYGVDEGRTRYAGTGSATLVKQDQDVLVSTHNAVLGDDPGTVQALATETFHQIANVERQERSALARLEAEMIRRFHELEEHM